MEIFFQIGLIHKMVKKGFFISFEGIDGCGKTSVISYLNSYLNSEEITNIREPGGTKISELIRNMLLNNKNDDIQLEAEALLYAAARNQVVKRVIQPAITEGKMIIADRFIDSTIAYQGYGRGLEIRMLKEINEFSTGGLKPDLTILLDLEPECSYLRNSGVVPDRIEREGLYFQHLVREGYLQIAGEEPERIIIVNADQEFAKVTEQVLRQIQRRINL